MIRSGPFLIQLKYSCKTLNSYNIVMDFIPGGSLFQFVQVRNLTIPEAKVCTAEIVLGNDFQLILVLDFVTLLPIFACHFPRESELKYSQFYSEI